MKRSGILAAACLPVLLLSATAWAQDLWINEFHYDNDGSDVGEFVEVVVADSVGTDPSNLGVVLYNGSNGQSYDTHSLDTFATTTIPGFTIYNKAISGIQNGGPDGIALIDSGKVVQFLSYEGAFTATNGPASGFPSTDIGVSESSSTPVGFSLQLSGSGSGYSEFSWEAPAAETPGAVNNGQTLAAAGITLAAGKSGPDFAVAGEQITYQINLDNLSDSVVITGLTVTDELPANTSYVSDTSGVTADTTTPGEVTWSLPDLVSEGSISFELVLAIDPAVTGLLVNGLIATGQAGADPVDAATSWETTLIRDVSIYEIQTPDDVAVDDASPLVGETVRVDGIVTAAPNEIGGPATAVIQESAGGPYSGVRVIGDFSAANPQRGDEIRLIGEVSDPFGLTQVSFSAVELVQSAVIPTPAPLDTSDFAPGSTVNSEPWESVLIEFTDVIVTNENPDDPNDFGEWLFSDGSGDARGDDFSTTLTINPALNDTYDFLRGIGWFSFSNYKVQPRDNADFGFVADVFSIEEIQGTGLTSPLEGQVVRTVGNIVTAVGSDFFVIQMPDLPAPIRGDLAPASRGLFVFTDDTPGPGVAVGDEVTVQGAVIEFSELTQIGFPDVVEITSSANPLPLPVDFDDQLPSDDPEAPSCGINNFECFESMRVRVLDGFVTGASQSFGSDPVAEAFVSANGRRTLRGPGVEFPGITGTCPNCPIWSGAPERFELDPDRVSLPNLTLAGGTTFSATGVIGYEFGGYELWPTELTVNSTPDLPEPAPTGGPGELTIASLNVLNLFDDVDDADRPIPACGAGYIAENRAVPTAAEYQTKLVKLAETIVQGLESPDVLALQEVESQSTLQALASAVVQAGGPTYAAYLIPGNDRGEINNGFLIDETRVAVDAVLQEGADECLSSDNTPLHDRPTLTLEGRFIADGADWPFVVMNNHLRSLGGVDDEARVRLKRHEQAQSIAARVQARQLDDPDLPVILVGDKNAFEFTDGYVDVVGLLRGTSVLEQNLVNIENDGMPGFDPSNQVSPPLSNAIERLSADERYSFVFRERDENRAVAQALDHALLNRIADRYVSDYGYMRGNADYWVGFEDDDSTVARSSDHDGLVLVLEPGRDIDPIFSDRFEDQP